MPVHDGRPGEGFSRFVSGVSVMGGPALPPPGLNGRVSYKLYVDKNTFKNVFR